MRGLAWGEASRQRDGARNLRTSRPFDRHGSGGEHDQSLTLAATAVVVASAGIAAAQTVVGGIVGGNASGLGSAQISVSATAPTLANPSVGVISSTGAATSGTIGDGRVGTLAPGPATFPGVPG